LSNAFVEFVHSVHFFAHDDFFVSFRQFSPNSGVADWFAFQGDNVTAGGWWANGDSNVFHWADQINFDFSVDGFENFDFVYNFDTMVDNW
jgi:hypothetical protein